MHEGMRRYGESFLVWASVNAIGSDILERFEGTHVGSRDPLLGGT